MGLLKAGVGAAGGVLADQWREYFYCESLDADTLVAKGEKRTGGRSSNTKGESNVISDGSIVAVADGQCMMIVENGEVVEVCAEPGEFVYDTGTEPSVFTGNLGDMVKKSFEQVGRRFTFGGDAGKDQRVYYFNTKEIVGNKYGTASPVPFRVVDNKIGLDVDITVRCNGEYSYKLVDPLMFYKNVCGNVDSVYTRDLIDSQLKSELLTALQPAFARISEMGIRYSAVPAHTKELADALNEELSHQWRDLRGLEDRGLRCQHHLRARGPGADDPRPPEGGRHGQPRDGGGQHRRGPERRHAHRRGQPLRRGHGLHGHGHGERRRWHERVAAVQPGCPAGSRPGDARGGGRRRGRGPRGGRRLDLLVRRPEHRQVLQQLRKPQA